MGDAGAAAVLSRPANGAGIFYRGFASLSEHWELATIACGGSMHPRGDEFTYLRGDGARAQATPSSSRARASSVDMMARRRRLASTTSIASSCTRSSVPYHTEMLAASGIPADKVEHTVAEFGNMASASIPVAFALAEARGHVGPGDRVMWLGMASGISVGVFMMDL